MCHQPSPHAPPPAPCAEPRPPDFPHILADLSDPANHDAALLQLKSVDDSALVPLWDAIANDQISMNVRQELSNATPAIYQRLRKARATQDQLASDAWNKTVSLDLYEKFGKKSPKWDADVAAGLTDHFLGDRVAHLKAATDAGCDDLAVRFFKRLDDEALNRAIYVENAGMETSAKADLALANEIAASPYPDALRFRAYCHVLYFAYNPRFLHDIPEPDYAAALDKMIAFLPAFAAAKPDDASILTCIHQLSWLNDYDEIDHKAVHDKIRPVLATAFPTGPWLDFFDGYFQVQYAWDARGSGTAGTVTDQGWQLFRQRLDDAHAALERGWRADPLKSFCADPMITVCMGQSADRPIMESWFSRALLANPDDRNACSNKMLFLAPKWEGSTSDQLAFARDCIRLGTGNNRISLLMVNLIKENQPEELADVVKFMAQPEIWREIQPAFDKLLLFKDDLQHNPRIYLHDRALYLRYACQCQQWHAFLELAKQFGDQISLEDFGGKEMLDYYLKKAQDEVAKNR